MLQATHFELFGKLNNVDKTDEDPTWWPSYYVVRIVHDREPNIEKKNRTK